MRDLFRHSEEVLYGADPNQLLELNPEKSKERGTTFANLKMYLNPNNIDKLSVKQRQKANLQRVTDNEINRQRENNNR